MSLNGTKRTPLFEVNVQHVVSLDDLGSPKNPLREYVNVFVRVYRWEFDVNFMRPGRKFYLNRYGGGNIPRLFGYHASFSSYPATQYSGDFTERMEDDPYYGQKPR